MGKVIITLWMSLWIVQSVVADEIIYDSQQILVNHSDIETSLTHIHLITAFRERFTRNQNQTPECMVNSSISEFPDDIFTNEQRLNGFVVLHLLGAIYFFTLLAVVCNDYFLPSVECICNDLNISKDVAAATFMATATTTPEFFTNVISTFIMDSDMGVGTIIGSLMFNTLGVAAVAGIASVSVVQLEWWPITRDSILYSVHLFVLILFAWDSKITLYESIVLVIMYFTYFVILFQNNRIKNFVTGVFTKGSNCRKGIDLPSRSPTELNDTPSSYDTNNNTSNQEKPINFINGESSCESVNEIDDHSTNSVKIGKSLWIFPKGTWQRKLWWTYTWPIKFILTITIPNPKTYKKLYPMSFALCIIWIGVNSYLIVWMMTVVGYTFAIPENVMGLTLLAAGGCMPEAISSVLMIRKGESGIGVSNSLGANSLAILMSLGVPWLIRNLIYQSTTDKSFIVLNSYGIEYTIASLLVATTLLYVVLAIAKYRLNKKVGFSLLIIYAIFLTLGILMELDIILPSGNCM